eukprot:3937767-Rhodomonas_salina.1
MLRTMYISRCCRSLTTTRHTREKGGPTRRGPTSTLELIERTSLPSISRITSPTLSLPESCAAAPLCNRRTCSPPPSTRAMSMPSPTFASESLSEKGMVGWRRSVTVSSRHCGSPRNVLRMRRVTVIGTSSGPTIRLATSSGVS